MAQLQLLVWHVETVLLMSKCCYKCYTNLGCFYKQKIVNGQPLAGCMKSHLLSFKFTIRGWGAGKKHTLRNLNLKNLQIFNTSYLHNYKFSSTCFLSALNVITCITFYVFKEMLTVFKVLECCGDSFKVYMPNIFSFPFYGSRKKIM